MDIKTKYNPGDEVWVMIENKPQCLIVNSITIIISLNNDKKIKYGITYNCSLGRFGSYYSEKDLFASKEELRDYLFNK